MAAFEYVGLHNQPSGRGRSSRRRFLRGAVLFGLSAPSIASALLADSVGAAPPQAAPTAAPANPSRTAAGQPRRGGILTSGRTNDSDNLDVAFAGRAIDSQVTSYVHETLVTQAPDLTFEPLLAESW